MKTKDADKDVIKSEKITKLSEMKSYLSLRKGKVNPTVVRLISETEKLSKEDVKEVQCSSSEAAGRLFGKLSTHIKTRKLPFGVSRSETVVFIYHAEEAQQS